MLRDRRFWIFEGATVFYAMVLVMLGNIMFGNSVAMVYLISIALCSISGAIAWPLANRSHWLVFGTFDWAVLLFVSFVALCFYAQLGTEFYSLRLLFKDGVLILFWLIIPFAVFSIVPTIALAFFGYQMFRSRINIKIQPAVTEDLDRLMEIFALAREFMHTTGNPNQWINGYPQREFMAGEIEQGHCYVCRTPERTIVATFCLLPSPDPTYSKIYDGQWLNDEPYHVIHRIASDGSVRGIGKRCIDWCAKRCDNLRIDTHADNHIMQSLAERCGFVRCGIIYVANGTPRIAYQRTSNKLKGIVGTARD